MTLSELITTMPQESDDRLRSARRLSKVDAYAVDIQRTASVKAPVAMYKLEALARGVLKAEKVKRAMLSISLVSPRSIASLNLKHLGHKGSTDVITFAMGLDPRGVLVADIYICPDVASKQAKAQGVSVGEELCRLVVHGVLHACGYEHPEDAREQSPMWRRQEKLLRKFTAVSSQPL